MSFFTGKEDMGQEASLRLLDLAPEATIDDANRAYGYLHRMVDMFHKEAGEEDRGSREEDMDLLTCAYEKAVALISDRHSSFGPQESALSPEPKTAVSESADLHFTVNFPAEVDKSGASNDASLPEPNPRTIQDAISITARRLRQTEAALPGAREAVDAALTAARDAERRHERARQARVSAEIAAKSAQSRVLLLEIEAKRAMEEAIAIAEKARDRVVAAKQAAGQARKEAEVAHKEAERVRRSEETAAAQVVCAEDCLEKEKHRLQTLTHNLLQTRERMKLFADTDKGAQDPGKESIVGPRKRPGIARKVDPKQSDRQRVLNDLLEIEASLQSKKQDSVRPQPVAEALQGSVDPGSERRQHHRVVYPPHCCPVLSMEGRSIPIIDMSTAGMRLSPDVATPDLRIVRGMVVFDDGQPLPVTGRVVRQDDRGLGLKLVTRIGDRILARERMRLCA
ncbi:PilZ domain-containing protein [uncultured Desulfosarcina sp.]|uniref:PilZ domain-containing protein n=1 Tax=uncultured Desulfosarcina sp. TaxID=218289 RepID=UPI0029C6BFF8|nr:PilZ domain-containing protein [uncultured Desulfosarcina sp.]